MGSGVRVAVSRLGPSIPRASNLQHFSEEPLDFLARARETHGNIFAIRDAGPVFSRAPDCTGVVAVFGSDYHRAVLSDISLFGMPESAAQTLKLPHNLINLNRGLHSMPPDQHAVQKRLVMRVLSDNCVEAHHRLVWTALKECALDWTSRSTMGLLNEMRELTLQASSRVLFGDRYADSSGLARLLQAYFQLRREASSPANAVHKVSREKLVAVGTSLDEALRMYARERRRQSPVSSNGLLARLATLTLESEKPLVEDHIVGHCNVLFVSSNEPVAVALTWTLLILSQLPTLRRDLRAEFRGLLETARPPPPSHLSRLPLLDRVVKESLRLLPPNALMVRITTGPTSLNGVELPGRCEIILCPFLAHRDPTRFPQPNEFLPARWKDSSPSPFDYFPFGAGGHSCVGRILATYLIKTALVFLLSEYDITLAEDQEVDWRVHIMLMPRSDPMVTIHPLRASSLARAGKLGGPVSSLLSLGAEAP
jgi:cytochrome P450